MKLAKFIFGLGIFGASLLFPFGANKADAAEISHTVASGETLSTIAQKYYGDSSRYTTIANANNISNANFIMVGQILKFDTEAPEEAYVPAAAEEPVQAETYTEAPAPQNNDNGQAQAAYTGNSSSAKEWIAMKESSGSYSATNGRYIGRYQLDASYLNGDYSAENQERVADQYVANRYGSWEQAQQFWMANGWY
ncbi:aggregation-promoting factor [Vagococcus acidifermentans]|uniref:LysM domain-containing protein n=1 Tax=Vagococcus acidifermentans TaxID=564710 RepID=A0A430AQQ2_9ENTE|nr:LysM peptidoglycan-binding domain-containing protein [Vagococcus acidifermentans]RSU10449.1 hypothetical protein CBF27_10570 [Vagococcus acidifermentans]